MVCPRLVTPLRLEGSGGDSLQVDCTEQQELCSDYGVSGYPTLKVFRNGVPADYAGPRKADGIISYMVKWVMTNQRCTLGID